MADKSMDKIVALCKNRGFIYAGSEIYGGLANSWDYGPIGSEMKKNIKDMWWKKFIHESKYNVGIDAAIIMNPEVWVTTGHVGGFSDPLIDCKDCKTRHRADKLIEEWGFKNGKDISGLDGWTNEQLVEYIKENNIECPNCGKVNFTDIRKFNLMFKTFMGVTEDAKSEVYLRPETAQGMFVNFKNVQRTTRRKLPMGIGQMGRSFRNEITPGNFIFRTREFEQMELEFFCKPGTDLEWYEYWKEFCKNWLIGIGIKAENLRMREHSKEELSFYSKGTTDIEYLFPFGWGELWGIADRTDYDLTRHMEASKVDLTYLDPETNERYVPYCVEPAVGVDRVFLTALCAITGNMVKAVKESSNVLNIRGVVLPATLDDMKLAAEFEDGTIIHGESNIPEANGKIKRLFTEPEVCEALPEAIAAINEADLIILGPGSLYTSVIPNLLSKSVKKAIDESNAKIDYCCNFVFDDFVFDGFAFCPPEACAPP